jgi:hypothetical protein
MLWTFSKTWLECEKPFTINVRAATRPRHDPFRTTDGFNIVPSYHGKGNQHAKLERAMLYTDYKNTNSITASWLSLLFSTNFS